MTLAELRPGDIATVSKFTGSGAPLNRMMQLGLLEGTQIEMVRKALTGDPMEIRLMGYSLSLRKSEADLVEIKDLNQHLK